MSRRPRVYCDSQIYHIILRGNGRQTIFYDDMDYRFFISRLEKYAEQLNIKVYVYCLMSNHVHILLGNANPVLGKFVQKLATSYAMYFNRKYERSGHVFQGRYKSEPVENQEYFKILTRYIIRNPEKAKLSDFHKYKWSSYFQLLGNRGKNFIEKNKIIEIFSDMDSAIKFIDIVSDDKCMEYEDRILINDSHCIQIIRKLFNLKYPGKLLSIPASEQKIKLKILKQYGASVNQLARLTGISRKIIKSA